jgi:hypothetical protein
MRGVLPFYKRDERERRERGERERRERERERETHLIPGIHRLSRGEQESDFTKVTILGSGVDGQPGTSERGRGTAHDETR